MATRTSTSAAPRVLTRWLRDYSLSIAIGALFLISFVLHTVFAWFQYVADQEDQGSQATVFGLHGFMTYFGEWTFQNWQSEFLEVLVLIVLTTYLVHKGSPESKDGDEDLRRAIARIEKKVDSLTKDSG